MSERDSQQAEEFLDNLGVHIPENKRHILNHVLLAFDRYTALQFYERKGQIDMPTIIHGMVQFLEGQHIHVPEMIFRSYAGMPTEDDEKHSVLQAAIGQVTFGEKAA